VLSSESKQSDKVEEIQQSLIEVDKDCNHQLTINKQQLAEDEPLDEEEETEDECCEQVLSSESEQSDEEEDRQQSLVQAMHVQCGNSNNSDSEQEEDSYIAESGLYIKYSSQCLEDRHDFFVVMAMYLNDTDHIR
jgi:hypothetical protein